MIIGIIGSIIANVAFTWLGWKIKLRDDLFTTTLFLLGSVCSFYLMVHFITDFNKGFTINSKNLFIMIMLIIVSMIYLFVKIY